MPSEGTNANPLPPFLRAHPRFIAWALKATPGGRPTKVPFGSVRKPEQWSSYAAVQQVARNANGGVGFVFSGGVEVEGGRLIALDLDACYSNGEPAKWARELIEAFGRPYTEISPSGRGLRSFLIVREPPAALPVIRVPAPSVEGAEDKAPQIQTFGLGSAGYVTVTGDRLLWTRPEPTRVESMGWLLDRYQLQVTEASKSTPPRGHGAKPTFDELRTAVAALGHERLIRGDWQDYGAEFESASDGWFKLVSVALSAGRGHVEEVADWLLEDTAWGRGDVDSRDPDKYRRRDWVLTDLIRVHSKRATAGSSSFDDGFDADSWRPPAPKAGGWFLTLEEYARNSRGLTWLFKGLLPAQGLAQLYGDPSSGKTTVAVDIAAHVALGRDWCGFACRRPGWVLYIAGEGGPGLNARFEAARRKLDPDLQQRFRVVRSDRAGAFTDPANRKQWEVEARAAMARLAESGEHVALVVIDTQARNFGPANENSSEDMSRFVAEIDELGKAVGALVMVVHHTGHAAKDRGRGSSAMFAALDAAFEVTRPEPSVVRVSTRKAKDWREPPTVGQTLQQVELPELDADGEPRTAMILSGPHAVFDDQPEADPGVGAGVQSLNTERALFVLEKLRKDAPTLLPYRDGCPELDLSAWAMRKLLDELAAAGLIAKETGTRGGYLLTDAGFESIATFYGRRKREIDELVFGLREDSPAQSSRNPAQSNTSEAEEQ